jgi:predicted metal-binding membrane protein
MWVVMMVAMMLPSFVPMLSRYRRAVGRPGEKRLGPLTALVGMGYFCVMDVRAMTVVTAASTIERLAPAGERVARANGVVVVAAGLFLIARSAGLR